HENPFAHDVDSFGLEFAVDLLVVVNNLRQHDIAGYLNRRKFFLAASYHPRNPSRLLTPPYQMLLVLFPNENRLGYDLRPFFQQVTMEIYLPAIVSYHQVGQNPTIHDNHLTLFERITPTLDNPLVQLLHINLVWHALRLSLAVCLLLFVLTFEFLVVV